MGRGAKGLRIAALPPRLAAPRPLFALAVRFRGLPADAPRAARQTPYAYEAGDGEEFTIIDLDQPGYMTSTATVRLITERACFFVEEGVQVDDATLQRIGRDFEDAVYPQVTAAFGKEPSPGVDADPRISIVHARLSGAGAAGFLAEADPQLNDWPVDGPGVHYQESQLFFRYLLDRFGGRENAAALLAGPGAGIAPGGGGGGGGPVHQFAADYLNVDPPIADTVFSFDGSDEAGIGIEPFDGAPSTGSGHGFWWSNAADDMDSRLTPEVDRS